MDKSDTDNGFSKWYFVFILKNDFFRMMNPSSTLEEIR